MKEYQMQNVRTFDDMYKHGWGNEWPSELMISYYHNIIRDNIKFSDRGGEDLKCLNLRAEQVQI